MGEKTSRRSIIREFHTGDQTYSVLLRILANTSEIMKQILVISLLAICLAYATASEMTMNQWCSSCDVDNSNIAFPTCCQVDKDFQNDCNTCSCVLLGGEKTPIGKLFEFFFDHFALNDQVNLKRCECTQLLVLKSLV